jgi:hypothetical protein
MWQRALTAATQTQTDCPQHSRQSTPPQARHSVPTVTKHTAVPNTVTAFRPRTAQTVNIATFHTLSLLHPFFPSVDLPPVLSLSQYTSHVLSLPRANYDVTTHPLQTLSVGTAAAPSTQPLDVISSNSQIRKTLYPNGHQLHNTLYCHSNLHNTLYCHSCYAVMSTVYNVHVVSSFYYMGSCFYRIFLKSVHIVCLFVSKFSPNIANSCSILSAPQRSSLLTSHTLQLYLRTRLHRHTLNVPCA